MAYMGRGYRDAIRRAGRAYAPAAHTATRETGGAAICDTPRGDKMPVAKEIVTKLK